MCFNLSFGSLCISYKPLNCITFWSWSNNILLNNDLNLFNTLICNLVFTYNFISYLSFYLFSFFQINYYLFYFKNKSSSFILFMCKLFFDESFLLLGPIYFFYQFLNLKPLTLVQKEVFCIFNIYHYFCNYFYNQVFFNFILYFINTLKKIILLFNFFSLNLNHGF